ncbi:hypothetical protein ACFQX7_26200 [Luedemannella flava]
MEGLIAAVVAGLLWRAYGLRPGAVAVWLAPLPLLLVAPRVAARRGGAAALAWLIGQSGMWTYYTRDIQIPRPVVAAMFLAGRPAPRRPSVSRGRTSSRGTRSWARSPPRWRGRPWSS